MTFIVDENDNQQTNRIEQSAKVQLEMFNMGKYYVQAIFSFQIL
jgi:hypothetical protein